MTHSHLQNRAVVKVVGAGPSLQRAEGHVASRQRGDVAELVGAERRPLVAARRDEAARRHAVGLQAGGAVVLVGQPGPARLAPPVDGEALGAAGVELETHVGDLEGLACVRGGGSGSVNNNNNYLYSTFHDNECSSKCFTWLRNSIYDNS